MRLVTIFAKDLIDSFEVIRVFADKTERIMVSKENPKMETLTHKYPCAIWFERKIHDDFGIAFENSFDLRPLVHQEYFDKTIHPMQKSFKKKNVEFVEYKPYKYETISGDGVFQVSVGPIHAGIIEPGHFHFSQEGENILHQEVRHFYKYRAIEKMLEGLSFDEARTIIEKISGNETIAYQIAFFDIMLDSANIQKPKNLKRYHCFLLELERIIHHLTDIGFIPNDAGFSPALAFCSKLSEEARVMMKKLTNHRFGFGSITTKIPEIKTNEINNYLDNLLKELLWFEDWIIDIPSVWDRFDTTGILPKIKALKYCTVGVMARASGVCIDSRNNSFYDEYGYELQVKKSGDVASRFLLRIDEIKNSIEMMKRFINNLETNTNIKEFEFNDGEFSSFSESSIGELFMNIEIKDGLINRFYVRDPSFINWQVLHVMMLKDIIADFPLINKSCDLSYAGNDL